MHVVGVGDREVKTHKAKVEILDISPGGLRFSSDLSFPIFPCILMEFYIHTCEQTICLKGYIVHRICVEKGLFKYGICFTDTGDSLHPFLLKLFNNINMKKRNFVLLLKFN